MNAMSLDHQNISVALKLNTLIPKQNHLPPIYRTKHSFFHKPPNSNNRLKAKTRIKCSFEHNNNNGFNNTTSATTTNNGVYEYERYAASSSSSSNYPRPAEIQWKKELCNTVHLIGNVGASVQIKHLPSGKSVAWSRLAVKKSQTETIWINLTFWDELAHVTYQHVEKGQQIYISGRLVSDTVESEDGKQQTYYKVVVQQLNFVEKGASSVPLYDGDSDYFTQSKKQNSNRAAMSTGSIEELWQAYFANPTEWWDNRKNKRSPTYPDFKHKDTGEALWVEGRNNPSWVKSQLSVLDSKMESYIDHNSSMRVNFMSPDDIRLF